MREVLAHHLRRSHRGFDLIDGQNEYFSVLCSGCLQQLEARSVAVVHLVAESSHKIDLIYRRFERGELNLAHGENAPDDLAESSKSCDHNPAAIRFDFVERARRFRKSWFDQVA